MSCPWETMLLPIVGVIVVVRNRGRTRRYGQDALFYNESAFAALANQRCQDGRVAQESNASRFSAFKSFAKVDERIARPRILSSAF
jgi:hypothetical protein